MADITTAKHAALLTQTGQSSGQTDDLEDLYLKTQTGLTTGTSNDLWYALFVQNGATSGAWNDAAYEFLLTLGAPAGHIDDMWLYFWDTLGGAIGPTVVIQRNNDPGFCEFEPPITDNCTASETYTANDTNFTNPADTWLWTIEPPVVGVDLTNATAKTCTVTTPTADADLTFNLKVVATDSVSTDTANRTTTFTQKHTDTNEPPAFIGPNINDVQFQLNVPISPFDFSVVFTGTNLVYDEVASTLPTGLTLDPNTGILTGTPTTEQVELLRIGATNSKPVAAISNQFSMTIINQSQILTVAEVSAGSCSFIYPQTGCTSQGTYDATPTGWTLPPDTWVWTITSVTQGSPVISSGQGTNTVTVDDTGPVDAQFTLKCVASNSTESAQDLTQFTQVHTDNTVAIAFDGPNIADQTFIVDELFTLDVSTLFSGDPIQTWSLLGTWPPGFSIDGSGVITGTPAIGDVGSYANLGVRAANSIPDSADSNTFNGTVQEAATGPAFLALTYDPNDTTYEMKGVVTGTGDLTTTHTSTLYAPDFEGVYRAFGANKPVWSGGFTLRNLNLNSNLTAGYRVSRNAAIAQDAVGLDGQANTAITLTHGPNTDAPFIYLFRETGVDSNATVVVYAKKGTGNVIRIVLTTSNVTALYDLNTGQVSAVEGGSVASAEIVDVGNGWYKCIIGSTSSFNQQIRIYPYISLPTPPDYLNPSDDCTVIIGNSEVYNNRTVAEVKNANGWIYTTTASQSKTWAIDGTGTPLAELPYLQYYPAAQNDCTYSRDLTNAAWFNSAGSNLITTYDQVGITGEPSTATLLSLTTGATGANLSQTFASATSDSMVGVFYVKKTAPQVAEIGLRLRFSDSITASFDTNTGVISNPEVFVDTEVIDQGSWWKVLLERVGNGGGTSYIQIYPGISTAAAQDLIVGNVELYLNKTIPEVRGGPIFTTTAAVATDATIYNPAFDFANWEGDESCWYAEVYASASVQEGSNQSWLDMADGHARPIFEAQGYIARSRGLPGYSSYTFTQPGDIPTQDKVAMIYSVTGNQMQTVWNGNYGNDPGYTGPESPSKFNLLSNSRPYARQIRNLQRYDITSYQNGKDIIDGLMDGAEFVGGDIIDLTVGDT